MEMQKRLRMEAVEKTTSMALYMSHSQAENIHWPLRITVMALNTLFSHVVKLFHIYKQPVKAVHQSLNYTSISVLIKGNLILN